MSRLRAVTEANAPSWWRGWSDQDPNRADDGFQFVILVANPALELRQTLGEFRLCRDPLPELNEGPNDEEAHPHGLRALEDRRRHQCAVFCKGDWPVLEVLPAL